MTAPDRIYINKVYGQHPEDWDFTDGKHLVKRQLAEKVEYVRADLVDPAAIREAWEKAYWRMRSYAVHDNDCKLNKPPRFDGPCSCGLTAALEEALALIQKGAADDRA